MYCQHCGKKLDESGVCTCLESNGQETNQAAQTEAPQVVEKVVEEPAKEAAPPPPQNFGAGQGFNNAPPPPPQNFGGQQGFNNAPPPPQQNFGGQQGFNNAPPPPPQNFGGQQGFNNAPPPPPQNFGGQQGFNNAPPPPQQNFGGQQGFNNAPPPPPQNFGGQQGFNNAPPPPPQNFGGQQGFNNAPPPPRQNFGGQQGFNNAPPPPQNFGGQQGFTPPPPVPSYGGANTYAPQPVPQGGTKSIKKLREVCTSPLAFAAIISLGLTTIMALINMFIPARSEIDILLGNSGIDPMAILGGFIGLTPQILVLVGVLIFMLSCMDKTGAPIKTTGLTLTKVGGMIWSIAVASALIIIGIVLMAASSMISSVIGFFGSAFSAIGLETILSNSSAGALIIVMGLVLLLLGVLMIFVAIGLLKTCNALKSVATMGSVTYGKVSMILIIMLFVSALFTIVSIIMSFVNPMTKLMGIDYMSLILSIIGIIQSVAFAIALINARSIK